MTKEEFIKMIYPIAQRAVQGTRVDPRTLVAMAIQEGGPNMNRPGNNFLNLTAGAKWGGPTINRGDTDAAGNPIRQDFRAYDTPEAGFRNAATMIDQSPNYQGALSGDLGQRAQGMSKWAEDQTYATKIAALSGDVAKVAGEPGLISSTGTATAPTAFDLNPYLRQGTTLQQGNLQTRLGLLLAAMPENIRKGFMINSGFRTPEQQQALWDKSDKSGKMVARPGGSRHEHGNAADLGYASDEQKAWIHANAKNYGLNFPMSYEPWHIETAEARGGAPWTGGGMPSGNTVAAQGASAPVEPPATPESGIAAFMEAATAPPPVAPAPPPEPAKPLIEQQPGGGGGMAQQGQVAASDLMQGLISRRRANKPGLLGQNPWGFA